MQSIISHAAVDDEEDEEDEEEDDGDEDDEADGASAMRRSPEADAAVALSALPPLPLSSPRSVPRRTCSIESERRRAIELMRGKEQTENEENPKRLKVRSAQCERKLPCTSTRFAS